MSEAKNGSALKPLLCGCGKEARYVHFDKDGHEVHACNKYCRCMTREELEKALALQNRRVAVYANAVNQIDEYFDSKMESKKDQKKVHQILGNLTDSLPT